jgi:hypothetical protein
MLASVLELLDNRNPRLVNSFSGPASSATSKAHQCKNLTKLMCDMRSVWNLGRWHACYFRLIVGATGHIRIFV